MKNLINILCVFIITLTSCGYDNYDPPGSQLSGKFVYEGTQVGVRHDVDALQLYEPGWQNFAPINVHVNQDGTFSALLFDGDYKLVMTHGNAPWVDHSDTIDIQMRGSQSIEVEVIPFFMIRNENIKLEGSNTATATFKLEQIVESRQLQYVSLYIGETQFVDNRFKLKEERLNTVEDFNEPITLSVDLSGLNKNLVFARIGVKTEGSSELLFSQVKQIDL